MTFILQGVLTFYEVIASVTKHYSLGSRSNNSMDFSCYI